MYKVEFTEPAKKRLNKLPVEIQKRITIKLRFFISQQNPLLFAEKLTDKKIGQFRFRIGNYRVTFDLEDLETIVIVDVDHRKDIYRR